MKESADQQAQEIVGRALRDAEAHGAEEASRVRAEAEAEAAKLKEELGAKSTNSSKKQE